MASYDNCVEPTFFEIGVGHCEHSLFLTLRAHMNGGLLVRRVSCSPVGR